MNRREMIGALGLSATTVVASGVARAQDHDHHHDHDGHLETLVQCAKVCNELAHHSLEALCLEQEASKREGYSRIREATIDCQAFCVLAATLMTRHSPMGHHAHAACAEACNQCAEVCESSGVESDEIERCIAICRECRDACRDMAKTPISHHHHDHS